MIDIDTDNTLARENCAELADLCRNVVADQARYNVYFAKKYGFIFLFNCLVIFMYLKC